MQEVKAIIKFDGPKLKDHKMDAAELARSLLAITEVFKLANKHINGKDNELQILVKTNSKQHCVELSIFLIATAWEQASMLVDNKHIITNLDLFNLIVTGPASLYKLVKKLKGKKIEKIIKNDNDTIHIKIKGDNNPVTINKHVYNFYEDKNVRQKVIESLKPLHKDGCETFEICDEKKRTLDKTTKNQAPNDISECPDLEAPTLHISTIDAVIRIRKPDYEGQELWRIIYKDCLQQAKISDTKWLKNFQQNKIEAPPGSALQVKLKTTMPIINNKPAGKLSYEIIEVYKVILPEPQQPLFNKN